jgi:hypothetical protein
MSSNLRFGAFDKPKQNRDKQYLYKQADDEIKAIRALIASNPEDLPVKRGMIPPRVNAVPPPAPGPAANPLMPNVNSQARNGLLGLPETIYGQQSKSPISGFAPVGYDPAKSAESLRVLVSSQQAREPVQDGPSELSVNRFKNQNGLDEFTMSGLTNTRESSAFRERMDEEGRALDKNLESRRNAESDRRLFLRNAEEDRARKIEKESYDREQQAKAEALKADQARQRLEYERAWSEAHGGMPYSERIDAEMLKIQNSIDIGEQQTTSLRIINEQQREFDAAIEAVSAGGAVDPDIAEVLSKYIPKGTKLTPELIQTIKGRFAAAQEMERTIADVRAAQRSGSARFTGKLNTSGPENPL